MKAVPVEGDSKASVTCTTYAFSLLCSQKAQRDAEVPRPRLEHAMEKFCGR